MQRCSILAAVALIALLVACAPPAPAPTPPPAATLAPTAAPTSTAGPVVALSPTPRPSPGPGGGVADGGGSAAVTQAVVQAAAERLAVGPSAVAIERVEPREWPDASLGCPQPGMMYAQVITPGYLVVVAAGGKRLEYHTDQRGRAVFCREL